MEQKANITILNSFEELIDYLDTKLTQKYVELAVEQYKKDFNTNFTDKLK